MEDNRNALLDAAPEVNECVMTQENYTNHIPMPDHNVVMRSSTGMSDYKSLQSRMAMVDKAPSLDALVPLEHKAEKYSLACQIPQGTQSSRQRGKRLGSMRHTKQVSEGTSNIKEREDGNSPSSSEDGVIQDLLIGRMQLTQESYEKFGMKTNLVFGHNFPDLKPYRIMLGKSAKLITLNEGLVAKLVLQADTIKDCLRHVTDKIKK